MPAAAPAPAPVVVVPAPPVENTARLAALEQRLRGSGYELTGNNNDELNSNETMRLQLANLELDVSYQVLASCDDDCSNLDLRLIDEDNNELVHDTASDALPVLDFKLDTPRNYFLLVHMVSCRVAPCKYELLMGKK